MACCRFNTPGFAVFVRAVTLCTTLLSLMALAPVLQCEQLAATDALSPQTFPLVDASALTVSGGKAEPVEYLGRKAVRLTPPSQDNDIYAFVSGTAIQDGAIDVDIAVKI